jgi:hypothetical protein
LFEEELGEILNDLGDRIPEREMFASTAAEVLAVKANEYGKDEKRYTPFQEHAKQSGHEFVGGKLDDVTVVVAVVVSQRKQREM